MNDWSTRSICRKKRCAIFCSVALIVSTFVACSADTTQIQCKETEEFFAVSPDAKITITNTDGSIHIFGWRDNRVRLATSRKAYSQPRITQIRVETTASANSFEARTIMPPAHGFFADKSGTVDYTINVPARARLRLRLTNGEISLDGLRDGDAEIELDNGRVTARNCAGRVRARARTGALEVIYQWWENFHASFDYAIDYGTIRTFLPAGAQFRVDALTNDGSIDDDFAHLRAHDAGRGQALTAETAPGASVALRFRDGGGNISFETVQFEEPHTLAARGLTKLQIARAN